MVFDNADTLSPSELEAFFPPGQWGNILITSRNSNMRCLTLPENSLEVTEMEENDAVALLLKACCLDPSGVGLQTEALKIVKELFCLPLAIDQAGAYIASGATNIGGYLVQYSKHRKTLLSRTEFTGASKYNRSVYRTWELSYQEIQQRAQSDDPHGSEAADTALLLLQLFSFFHHEGITEEIFAYAAVQCQETPQSELPLASSILDRRLLPVDDAGIWDNFTFREGIQILISFCLIKQGLSNCEYNMHPLVHAWSRDRMVLSKRQECSSMAYVILSCSLRWDRSQPYGFRRALVTHVRANMQQSITDKHQKNDQYFDDTHEKFGWLLREQGYSTEAQELDVQVLDARERVLGIEHIDTMRAMANIARNYADLGDYNEAEKLEKQILDTMNRILGVEHPDTISVMANLAATYADLENYTEAVKLQKEVLNARNRILGVEHPDTVSAMANLAATYAYLGNYTEAVKLQKEVVDARIRILGVEHPHTIMAMGNLAVKYGSLGKYIEAEKLQNQILEASIRISGVEHPNTIMAMANLAAIYEGLGKYNEAEKIKIQVLDARTSILGVEHPDTIWAMANLAVTYVRLGKYIEAEMLGKQVLNARNRILGVAHLDTITAMASLARTYAHLGNYSEAEKLEKQVLEARIRILEPDHPHTIIAMANIAVTYGSLGKHIEAEVLGRQVLDARNRILGTEHPDTILAMGNLATTYANLGNHKEAEKLRMQVLDARNRILGVQHPETISAIENQTNSKTI
jgi:tetratricopeptide (TPR) repeat protein